NRQIHHDPHLLLFEINIQAAMLHMGCCDPVDHVWHRPERSGDLEPMTPRLKVRDALYPLGSPN
ncbi:MAG: hypothetical protein K2K63_11020, partial [Acetatifactor sp.]|nr:hypothetical protein [Acetatifactor sp.]